ALRIVKESVLPPTLSDAVCKKAKELFAREALILTKLRHSQIARVFDFFAEDGRDYLVLDFIPGQSITQLIRQTGPQSEERVLEMGKQLADVLNYLHSQTPPVIHRDITPDNIVIQEDGKLALIDFGAANEYLGTATGTMVGKQSYIAPEQFRGKATLASDLYAVGGSMYYMLTGRDPEPLTACRPRDLNSRVSVGMDEIVCRCMAQEAVERVATGAELLEMIENLLNDGDGGIINISGRETEAR
ncbi:MAG: serine/threonine protein kinase, partial [Cyanobacteria bacterium]|nr:serine/threonine protein kinase [Cyanobacteriota bacterium]